ncbi:MAG TPA: hypothetical protein VD902_11890 [Symbiobacteriaceae bacterium]|nr:hypothetical protein [Symbiobacteriaceae bacterium]
MGLNLVSPHLQSPREQPSHLATQLNTEVALLAYWVAHRRNSHADQLILHHFVGAAPSSWDRTAVLRWLTETLQRSRGGPVTIPEHPARVRDASVDWLTIRRTEIAGACAPDFSRAARSPPTRRHV